MIQLFSNELYNKEAVTNGLAACFDLLGYIKVSDNVVRWGQECLLEALE